MLVVLRERQVERHRAAVAKQILERGRSRPSRHDLLVSDEWIACPRLHPQGPGPPCDGATNPAKANDAEAHPGQPGQPARGVIVPASSSHGAVQGDDTA